MRKIWKKVATVGLHNVKSEQNSIEFIVINMISIIISVLFFVVTVILSIQNIINSNPPGITSFATFSITLLGLLNFYLVHKGYLTLAKIILSLVFPLILLGTPVMAGDIIDEHFFWFPFSTIAFVIIAHFIFSYKREKVIFWVIIVFYFIITVFMDKILMISATEELDILPIYLDNYLWIKVANLVLFLFVNFSFYYILRLYGRSQKKLTKSNIELNKTITKLRNAQDQLIQSEKMASLGTLTAGIAHEINNPLNFIYGSLQTIDADIQNLYANRDTATNRDLVEFKKNLDVLLKNAYYGVDRATEIVKSLKSFSYQGDEASKQCDPAEIIQSALLILQNAIPESIDLQIETKGVENLNCYPDRIQQALINIIDNAVYAIKTKEKLENEYILIRVFEIERGDKKYVRFLIRNSGPQIPDESINYLFDPFYTTKAPGEGTGLGLYIAYNIALEHKGNLEAKNCKNGVSFSLTLPLGVSVD